MLYEEPKHSNHAFQDACPPHYVGAAGPQDEICASSKPMPFFGAGKGTNADVGQLFGGLFDGDGARPSTLSNEAPAHASSNLAPGTLPAATEHTTGLGSYQVVPDGFIGPLAPGEIHKSEYKKLKKYGFDKMQVVEDGFTGPMSNKQMSQGQFDHLAHGWLNILDDKGMKITGDGKHRKKDEEGFRKMMARGMGDSPAFRDLISDIGNDTDPAHQVQAKVGRNQPGVIFDNFGTNEIDLADLRKLPTRPGKKHPNEFSRTEDMAHFLSERQFAAKSANPADFGPAHRHGVDVQNQYRAERGQAKMLSQDGVPNPHGGISATFAMDEGITETMDISASGKIGKISRP